MSASLRPATDIRQDAAHSRRAPDGLPVNVEVEGHRQLLKEVVERSRAADVGGTEQQRGFDLIGAAKRIGERAHDHAGDARNEAGPSPSRAPDVRAVASILSNSASPELGQVRGDVGIL